MRKLTRREIEAFETAWTFMERVGGCCARNGEPERSPCDLRVNGDPLPEKVIALVHRAGGLKKVNALFNGMTKGRNFGKFMQWIMERREQPRDYWAKGAINYEPVRMEGTEIVYEEERS